MRKLKKTAISLVAAIGISGVLSGCIDPGRDVTVIYPVNDYVAVYGGAIATYDNNGTMQERKFDDGDVYSCEESSRVIGVGKEYRDGSKHLRLFLYLNEDDFEKYEEDRSGFSGEEKENAD